MYLNQNAGRAKQMAGIEKCNGNIREHFHPFPVRISHKLGHRLLCIGNGIHRHIGLLPRTLSLTVTPLGFKFLNVRRISQHDAA